MLYGYSLIILLNALAILPCFGFIAERSVNIPTTWNIAPSLETEQKVTVQHISSEKTQATIVDKVFQTTDIRASTKAAEQTASTESTREKTSTVTANNVEEDSIKQDLAKIDKDIGTKIIDQHVAIASTVSNPRNVILVLSADLNQDRDNFWKNFEALHSFPVKGYLQNCHNIEMEGAPRFTLDEVLDTEIKAKVCDCEHFLRSNIAALLLWARDTRGMTIGSLSNTNFTISPLFGYEEPIGAAREVDEAEENNMKSENRKIIPETHWHVLDLGRSSNHASSLALAPNTKDEGTEESMWNVFDMFSKVRMALLQSLLEPFSGNTGAPDDSISSSKSRSTRSSLLDMDSELKSLQNEKGFILVATASANELNSALDTLQHEVSQDTLVVVTGTCSEDKQPIPYFAQGPAAKRFRVTKTIWDLPRVIENIIRNNCQNAGCRIRRHGNLPLPIDQPKVDPQTAVIFERVKRNATEKSDEKNTVEVLSPKEGLLKADGKRTTSKVDIRSSASNFKQAEKFTTIFGTILSFLAAFALTS